MFLKMQNTWQVRQNGYFFMKRFSNSTVECLASVRLSTMKDPFISRCLSLWFLGNPSLSMPDIIHSHPSPCSTWVAQLGQRPTKKLS